MTTEKDEESTAITGKEIGLFFLFGVLPLAVLYVFASQGMKDSAGAAFEEDRRVLLSDCRDKLRNLDACRARVDAHVQRCAAANPRPTPLTDAYMLTLRACVNEGADTWQLPPSDTMPKKGRERSR
jgi:hypothetical protein